MARSLANKPNVQAPGGDYPFGRIKDVVPSVSAGTPVDEEVYGDFHQFFEKLMSLASVSANELPENNSDGFQWIEAFQTLVETFAGTLDSAFNGGLKRKKINIGDWNMDSTQQIAVAHELTFSKIRSVSVFILRDDVDIITNFLSGGGAPTALQGTIEVDATHVQLLRLNAGYFDSANYNATSFNRGYIIIEYIA